MNCLTRSEYPIKRARVERSSSIVEVGPESPSLPMNYISQKHKVKQPDPYDFNDDEQSINPATVSKRMFRSSRDDFLNKRMVCALYVIICCQFTLVVFAEMPTTLVLMSFSSCYFQNLISDYCFFPYCQKRKS